MTHDSPAFGRVLKTQKPVLELQHEIAETQRRLQQLRQRLARAIEAHREQIKKTLTEPMPPAERQIIEKVACYWDVSSVPHESKV